MSKWLRRTFTIALIFSILLHILVAICVVFFRLPMPHEAASDAIEVFDAKGMHLADQMLPGNRQIPKRAGHIGVEDNAVAKETVAQPSKWRSRKQRAASQPSIEARQEAAPNPDRPSGAGLPFTKDSLYAVDPKIFSMKQPAEPASPKKRSMPRTAVSSTMNIESQAYLSEDYYPNYSHGAHTYVNVLRHPDVEYFVRLKRAFKQTWNPFPAAQQYLAGDGARQNSIAVVLAVSVDPGGNMSELFVLKSSGSGYYDDEALRTVRANAPFSSPPARLLKENLLRMSWTFIVYM